MCSEPTHLNNIQTKLPKVGTTIFTVMSQLAVEHKAVNLGQGFPDFDTPAPLVEALARAAREGKNQYAPMTGLPALRQAIATKTAHIYGRSVDADAEITVTSGGSEAIFDAVLAVVRPGEEVIVLDPCYDCYEPAIDLAGARAVRVPLGAHDFSVDWQKVRDAITPRTRMLMINSPHNPSGAMLSAADMATLCDILRGTDILLLSDEVYEHIVYDGTRHESVLRYPELAERSFVISSFGKTYHCTGWKIGYCVAPRAIERRVPQGPPVQHLPARSPRRNGATGRVLVQHPEHHQQLGAFYQPKRDHFRELLSRTKLKPLPVPGGYFQLADYSAISDLPDAEFACWLTIEHGVTGIPLSPFYETPPAGQRLIRFCFAKNEATLESAIERLQKL